MIKRFAEENPWATAIISGAGLLGLAIFGAVAFETSGLLSTVPPPTEAVPDPGPDTDAGNLRALYQSAFTAWAALILLVPAYGQYLGQGTNRAWLAFWTVSYVAYLVHLYVSAFWFFGGNFGWMTTSSRVSAFWPGMALILWWGVDIALAFRRLEAAWVRVQRGLLHLGTFVLFFGGSAIKGESVTVKALGAALLFVALASLVQSRMKPQVEEG